MRVNLENQLIEKYKRYGSLDSIASQSWNNVVRATNNKLFVKAMHYTRIHQQIGNVSQNIMQAVK
jgi:hypothetical protein